jgi:hypothetical protein
MSAPGTSRHFTAAHQFGRNQSKADIQVCDGRGGALALGALRFSALSRYDGNRMFVMRPNTSDVIVGMFAAAFCSRTHPDKRTI